MKPVFVLSAAAAFLCLFLGMAGCGSDSSPPDQNLAIKVNQSTITLEEFNELLKFEAWADPEMDISNESRDAFIDYLIRKELMIQEASRRKLDRKKEFVRTIEKYWEATLIRNLLDVKAEEYQKQVLVTEDEISQYYTRNQEQFERPLDQVKSDIRQILVSEKLENKMAEWVADMRQNADITIDKNLISQDQPR